MPKKHQRQTICESWVLDPLMNPVTNRSIVYNGPTYRNIKEICDSHTRRNGGVKGQDSPYALSIPGPEPLGRNNRSSHGNCVIRKCNMFFPKAKIAPPPRLRHMVLKSASECHPWVRNELEETYNFLGLCEAPADFQANHWKLIEYASNNEIYDLMTSHLHLLYGAYVIPGSWYVQEGYSDIYYEPSESLVSDDFYDDFEVKKPFSGVIRDVIKSGKELCALGLSSRSDNYAHALVMVIRNHHNKELTIGIIDPMMGLTSDDLAMRILKANEHKYGYVFTGIISNPSFNTKYQAANSRVPYSHLDPNGYCGVWANLIMEYMILRLITDKGNKKKNHDMAELLRIKLPEHPWHIWRKLVIDYFFTRLLDTYAMAHALKRRDVASMLENHVISKYAKKVFHGRIFENMRKYVPMFDTEVGSRMEMHAAIAF